MAVVVRAERQVGGRVLSRTLCPGLASGPSGNFVEVSIPGSTLAPAQVPRRVPRICLVRDGATSETMGVLRDPEVDSLGVKPEIRMILAPKKPHALEFFRAVRVMHVVFDGIPNSTRVLHIRPRPPERLAILGNPLGSNCCESPRSSVAGG